MTKKAAEKDETNEIPSAPAIFDVSKPGETAAHPTSRPLIVGHKSEIKQDPMVTSQENSEEAEEQPEEIVPNKSEPIIKPDEDTEETQETTEEKPSETTDEADSSTSVSTSETGEIDALASEAEAKKQSKDNDEKDTKEAEQVQELISSKKYSIPIKEGGKKRSSEIMMIWFLIFLIFISAAAWFVVDAGYYDPGFELPYDLIKN